MDAIDINIIEKARGVESQLRLVDHKFDAKTGTLDEKAHLLQEKIINLYEWKTQTEAQQREALEKMQKIINLQTHDIQKTQDAINTYDENIKNLKHTISQIEKPKAPKPPKAEVPVALPPIQINLSEIYEKIEKVKQEILEKISSEKEKNGKKIAEQLKSFETMAQKSKYISENAIEELRDKLAWLPISLNQLEGMSPGEARLFTIEARLRSEENSRIESYNHLLKLIDSIVMQEKSQTIEPESIDIKLDVLNSEQTTSLRRSEKRKTTPAPISSQTLKKYSESDKKNYTDSGSVLGNKLKFSTPVPELDENNEIYLKYREMRKMRNVPKSCEIEPSIITRIQSAVPSKTRQFKGLAKTNKVF